MEPIYFGLTGRRLFGMVRTNALAGSPGFARPGRSPEESTMWPERVTVVRLLQGHR